MTTVDTHHLEYAKCIYHAPSGYPAVELSIDGHIGYLLEVDINLVRAGYIGIADRYDKSEWHTWLPEVHVPTAIQKKYGLPETLEGVTQDPTILKIAELFWKSTSTGEFHSGTYLFKEGRLLSPS